MEAIQSTIDLSPERLLPQDGRDELNFAEFPIAILADRAPKNTHSFSFSDTTFDKRTGKTLVRKVTVASNELYGLPVASDQDIILALIYLTRKANNFTDRTVLFAMQDILEPMGLTNGGGNYVTVVNSLNRWVGVTLYYDNAWWNKETQSWDTIKFHILETVKLADTKKKQTVGKQRELPLSSFTWNEVVFNSFKNENIKKLNLDVYFSLKSAISRRMYRFLDKRFYHRAEVIFDLRDFAFEHIGISRNYSDNGKIKEKLQKAIEELEEIGFLKRQGKESRYQKVGKNWRIRFTQATSPALSIVSPPDDPPLEAPTPLAAELVARGVTRFTADELVRQIPEEVITLRIEILDWLISKKDKKGSTNPAGYLVDSIRKEYAAPKGFKSKAEQAKEAAATKEQARQDAENRRLKLEQQAREEQERKVLNEKVDAYLAKLSPDERRTFEQQALASAGSDGRFFRDALIREHVIKVLGLGTDA